MQQSAAKRQNQQRSIANQLVGESRLGREEREDGLEQSVQLAAEAMRRLDTLGERSLAADQELRRGLALLPSPPSNHRLKIQGETRGAAFSSTGTYLAIATSLGNIVVRNVLEGSTRIANSTTRPRVSTGDAPVLIARRRWRAPKIALLPRAAERAARPWVAAARQTRTAARRRRKRAPPKPAGGGHQVRR